MAAKDFGNINHGIHFDLDIKSAETEVCADTVKKLYAKPEIILKTDKLNVKH